MLRDLIISVLLCAILLAVFWTQRRIATTKEIVSAPVYNHCPRDDYPCMNEPKRPWNKEQAR